MPPPLAFSEWGNDYLSDWKNDAYSLYDVETMTISTVARNGILGQNEMIRFPIPPNERHRMTTAGKVLEKGTKLNGKSKNIPPSVSKKPFIRLIAMPAVMF
jgi:hypothetical protein